MLTSYTVNIIYVYIMYITYSIQVHIIQYIYTYTIQVHNLYKDTEWNYTKYAYIIRGGRPE